MTSTDQSTSISPPPKPPPRTGAALVIDLDGYEGPLHVLLALARAQKVDLLKLSVADLADQYLAFIATPSGPTSRLPPTTW